MCLVRIVAEIIFVDVWFGWLETGHCLLYAGDIQFGALRRKIVVGEKWSLNLRNALERLNSADTLFFSPIRTATWIHIQIAAPCMWATMNTTHEIWLDMELLPLYSRAATERYTTIQYQFRSNIDTDDDDDAFQKLWNQPFAYSI